MLLGARDGVYVSVWRYVWIYIYVDFDAVLFALLGYLQCLSFFFFPSFLIFFLVSFFSSFLFFRCCYFFLLSQEIAYTFLSFSSRYTHKLLSCLMIVFAHVRVREAATRITFCDARNFSRKFCFNRNWGGRRLICCSIRRTNLYEFLLFYFKLNVMSPSRFFRLAFLFWNFCFLKICCYWSTLASLSSIFFVLK